MYTTQNHRESHYSTSISLSQVGQKSFKKVITRADRSVTSSMDSSSVLSLLPEVDLKDPRCTRSSELFGRRLFYALYGFSSSFLVCSALKTLYAAALTPSTFSSTPSKGNCVLCQHIHLRCVHNSRLRHSLTSWNELKTK
ncbi:hypothetical protein J6590_062007 [Homalodisca vitripennis]|nr:hypothetical protein J6590_062007 [Homalodisca vitripennis]